MYIYMYICIYTCMLASGFQVSSNVVETLEYRSRAWLQQVELSTCPACWDALAHRLRAIACLCAFVWGLALVFNSV